MMTERILLVDYENIQAVDLPAILHDVKVRFVKMLPHKRKGLEGKVKSWFPDLLAEERSALVQRLIEEGFVRESEQGITFVMSRLR
jgi:hypothetical protein